MTTTLASSGTNLTAIGIILAIFVPICTAIAIIVWNFLRLQRHRADAVAMASYRKLAEEAVASMAELRSEMAKLSEHVSAVEQLMRDVG
jgi:ABC-type multidrug transport system fused ATPase/permease subunit